MSSVKDSKDEYKTVHGVRALGALALVISHKTMALFYNPYVNRSTMSEVRIFIRILNFFITILLQNLGMKWSVIGRTAIIYTDGFMLISGFLTANALLKELDKGRTMKIGDKILSRIFR